MRSNECKFVNAEILLPNKKKFAIDLGMKKCSAFKAHLATPEGGLGGKVAYLVKICIEQIYASPSIVNI